MVLRLLILLAVIAAPLEPVEAQYRGTRIVRVKQATGPKRVQDPAAELARLKGNMEAIESASVQKRCGIEFRRA